MPAKSRSQANLMRAAEHGASFPMARKVRASMTADQLHDFAKTKSADLPKHVKAKPLRNPQLPGNSNRYGKLRG